MAVTHDFETLFREMFPRLVSLGALKTGRVEGIHTGPEILAQTRPNPLGPGER